MTYGFYLYRREILDTIEKNYVYIKEGKMSGSTFGKIFQVTTWGESHGRLSVL